MNWQVYIILCSDATLYTGITNDLARRYAQHGGRRGARYFRGRRPVRVVYLESGHSHVSASRRETSIKKLSRGDKIRLLASPLNELAGGEAGAPGAALHASFSHS
jgi:putative endonuclease